MKYFKRKIRKLLDTKIWIYVFVILLNLGSIILDVTVLRGIWKYISFVNVLAVIFGGFTIFVEPILRERKRKSNDTSRETEKDNQHSQAPGNSKGNTLGPDQGSRARAFNNYNLPIYNSVANIPVGGWMEIKQENPPIEEIHQEDPIRAWRGLWLRADGPTVLVVNGVGTPLSVGEEVRASCRQGPELHSAPDWGCTCGYHAPREKAVAWNWGNVVGEVDLYGKVIECDEGYRAEYMRLLSVHIFRPSFCEGRFLCGGIPQMVVFGTEVRQNLTSPTYVPPTFLFDHVTDKVTRIQSLLIVCTACATGFQRSATLQQISARLGLEVRFVEELNK
jgi:hypothetical protein